MARYSYEDFEKAAQAEGLLGKFSEADLKLARNDPDAGMSILSYKKDYVNATTDEARALANMGAEGVRSSYGNYTGGTDGSKFYLDPLTPSSFEAPASPTYQNNYAGEIADLYARQRDYGSYDYGIPKPEYANRYDNTIQDLLGKVVNRDEFSYDPATDPLYSQYRKQYTREGQRATADALGAAAAASGGIASSYANTAAAQAGNYYASQMTDKIPELYQMAYNKYLNDYNMRLNDLSAVQGAERSDYDKFLNELQQYNADRNFDYNAWTDEYNRIGNDLQTASGLEQLDYTKYLNDLGQYNADRSFDYGVLMDEINSQTAQRQEAMNRALTAAEFGDYSMLNEMGIGTDNNPEDFERRYRMAVLAAEYGDYSMLNEMGIGTDNNPEDFERRYRTAMLAAEYGDFSGLRALGIRPDAAGLYGFNATAAGQTGGGSSGGGGSGGGSGGGGSSGGGSSGGGNGGTAPAGISSGDAQALAEFYGGKELTDAQWNEIMQSYPGLTDEALQQAGFVRGQEATPTTTVGRAGLSDKAQLVLNDIYRYGGNNENRINMAQDAYNKGLITQREAEEIFNRLNI